MTILRSLCAATVMAALSLASTPALAVTVQAFSALPDDIDGDGLSNDVDFAPTIANASQTDEDGDGLSVDIDPDDTNVSDQSFYSGVGLALGSPFIPGQDLAVNVDLVGDGDGVPYIGVVFEVDGAVVGGVLDILDDFTAEFSAAEFAFLRQSDPFDLKATLLSPVISFTIGDDTLSVAPVPLPAGIAFLLTALVGWAGLSSGRRRAR